MIYEEKRTEKCLPDPNFRCARHSGLRRKGGRVASVKSRRCNHGTVAAAQQGQLRAKL
jgi:hypothetical protein